MANEPRYIDALSKLRAFIKSRQVNAGARLPPERRLAEQFRVSRHSLREAIRIMERQGALSVRHGSGIYLNPDQLDYELTTIFHATIIEKQRLKEIFHFRSIIEPDIAALAARNISENDLHQLHNILTRQATETGTDIHLALDVEFHLLIAENSQNHVHSNVLKALSPYMEDSRTPLHNTKERRALFLTGHHRIFNALKTHNPRAAEEAMRDHIADVASCILV